MTYSPIQLDIIRTFGSKELSEGCLIMHEDWTKWKHWWNWRWEITYSKKWRWWSSSTYDNSMWEIIWHIPELFPCIARVAKEKGLKITILYYTEWPHIIFNPIEYNLRNPESIPYNPTLSLIDQSEDTLTQLLNLFK